MALPGSFQASGAGAATYSIPIGVPPGTAGMAPSLSLDYSSQGGSGIVGLGWSLSGVPSIGRCPRTVAQDGVHGSVNYDANDRFCMEGQRLVAISGTYGADGTEYRTEVDSYTRILSHGAAGNGPAWFEVHTKAGQILQYGNTADSQALAIGKTTARSWAVNKVSDTKGNYYTITYTNDTVNGQAYPIRIDYTGNAAAGLSPYNSVRFVYNTSRPDVVPGYQAGSLQQITELLTDVQTYAGSTEVSDYKLTYQLGSATSTVPSHVTSIQQCDGSGNCLPATSFGWQGSGDTVTLTATPQSFSHGHTIYSADFNGDGLTDVYLQTNGSCPAIYFGTQSGGYTASTGNFCGYNSSTYETFVGDFNADGLSDMMGAGYSGGCVQYYSSASTWGNPFLSYGQGNFYNAPMIEWSVTGSCPPPSLLVPGDFNGDGRTDVLFYGSSYGYSNTYLFQSNGDGTFTSVTPPAVNGTTVAYAGDFDGDGCTDVLETGNKIFYSCNPAVAAFTLPNLSGYTLVLGDFNGDGKTDILAVSTTGPSLLYLSTGTGLAAPITLPSSTGWGAYTVVTGDWNGDGRTDIALISKVSGTPHQLWLSTGTSFVHVIAADIPNTDTNTTATVADWNNDGASDLWLQRASGDSQYLTSFAPYLINSITNGLGATTTVAYDRLNHGTIYTKGSGAGYPILDLVGASYVVSDVATSNGVGGTYALNYAYATARADLSGRGFLGFGQTTVTDPQTGIVHTTNYLQTFPFTGLVDNETKVLGSAVLNRTVDTYGLSSSGGVYQVSLTQAVANGADLDGSGLPTVTTTYQYDAYGNPTQIVVSTPDNYSKTTVNTYTNDTVNWYLGRLTNAMVTSQEPVSPPPPPSMPPTSVTIGSNQTNLDLWNYLVANGYATSGTPGYWVVTVAEGIVIGSNATTSPALDTGAASGAFPSGSTLQIINNGSIIGAGGTGGTGGAGCSAGTAGLAGGTGLNVRVSMSIVNGGTIAGGGGGGGGGGGASLGVYGIYAYGGGGGGGAGTNGNNGGAAVFPPATAGGPGFLAEGGLGGNTGTGTTTVGGAGGTGGGLGKAGAAGVKLSVSGWTCTPAGGSGGAAGSAVVGSSHVIWFGQGTIAGALN